MTVYGSSPELGGTRASLEGLLGLRFAARDFRFVPRRRALAKLAGHQSSNFRGRGIEFDEVRRYQAGDEVRAIDWRVTARTGQPHTRLYREERERPILLLADQRQSMFFGSRLRFKSVQALNCAALLAWAALGGGDRVGGLVCGPEGHLEVKPRRSRRTVLQLLNGGLQANLALRPHLADRTALQMHAALTELRRIARPGSALFLISDFHDWNDAASEQLTLLARHCEVTAIHISDPLERCMPPPGRYLVSDGGKALELDSFSPVGRRAYQLRYQVELDDLRDQFMMIGAPLVELGTEDSALETLRRYYARPRHGAIR